jgi:tRNA nucleotidyltransferase (CCA-adding enzyme)
MDFLEKLGGRRLLSELVQILKEHEPLQGIWRTASLGLLRFIHPELALSQPTRLLLEETRYVVSWFDLLFLERRYESWLVYFLAMCDSLSAEQFAGTCARLSFNVHLREKLIEMRGTAEELMASMERRLTLQGKLENNEIYYFLRDLSVEVLLYRMAKTGNAELKRCISLYFTKLHGVHTQIGGEDLKRLGVPPGPRYREILDAVLSARLNGTVNSKDEELNMARSLLR